MRFKTWAATAAMLSVALLSACGGGSKGSSDVEIRLVNASAGYSSLDLSVNSTAINTGVAYGAAGSYGTVSASATTSQVLSSGTTLVSTAPTLSSSYKYSLIAYGWPGAVRTSLLQEGEVAPASGSSKLLVLNLAPDAGALDVYLTNSTDPLDNATPIASGIAGGSGSGYNTLTSGTFRVRVTGAGNRGDLRLDLPSVTLNSTEVSSLIITATPGGVLVNGITLVQTAVVTNYPGSTSRVRVVGAVAGNASVAATRAGFSLLSTSIAPSIGDYAAVASGNGAVTVNVNGTALPVLTPALTAGGDYTLLVWGEPSAPQISVLSDDNRLPTTAGTAKIRLINGVASLNAGLTMSLDYSAIAANVNPGNASAIATVPSSTSSLLSITSPTSGTPVYTLPTLAVNASGVYSVFMMGGASNIVGTLRRER